MSPPPPRTLVGMRALEAPKWGQYPLVASMVTEPASRTLLGYGPAQFLGIFDTRPGEPVWQPEVHRSLEPVASPGGVSLRWMAPRNTRIDGAGAVQTLQPAFENAIALTLYVGGLDILPGPDTWVQPSWPGRPVGSTAFAFSKAVPNIPSIWQMGLAFQRPTQVGQAGAPGDSGQFGLAEQQDGFGWMRLINGMPMLDLLSYAGQTWAEADLWELAGGTRYVAAWLRLWWSRFNGDNTLASMSYYLPYTLSPGRPAAPCHRHSWHCAYPMVPREVAAQVNVYDDGTRFQVSSPISGTWRVGAENNGNVGDNGVHVGLELRGSVILNRAAMTVAPNQHGLIIGPTTVHGGAGVLSVGYPVAGQQDAMLVHVAVSGAQ